MIWFWSQYVLSSEQMSEPYASPLLASLENLPPAVVLIAEFDPLYDEGNDYAHALRNAGVEVTLLRYEGMIHAFARRVQQFEMARKAIQDIGQRIRAVIGGPANPS
jgi:acetyl esterase